MRLPRPLWPHWSCTLNSLSRSSIVLSAYGDCKTPRAISATARGAATIAGARAAAPRAAAASSSIEPALPCQYKMVHARTACRSFSSVEATSDAASSADDVRVRPFSLAHTMRSASGTDRLTFNRYAALPSAPASTVTTSNVTPLQLERRWSFPAKPPHIPAAVWRGMLRGLHLTADNPIGITARLVNSFFRHEAGEPLFSPLYPTPQRTAPPEQFAVHHNEQKRNEARFQHASHWQEHEPEPFVYLDSLSPLVTVRENFDSLLIDAAHCSRSTSDTYYLDSTFSLSHAELASLAVKEQGNSTTRTGNVGSSVSSDTISSDNSGSGRKVLRTHGTAYQAGLLGCGIRRAIWSGAVARRDQVDPTHYPVFHQIDGIRVFDPKDTNGTDHSNLLEALTQQHASLLEAVNLTRQMRQLQQQQLQTQETAEELRSSLRKAWAAAGLSETSGAALCSFSCIEAPNPHRNNPVVLQLQITLERLLRFLWSNKPRVLSTESVTSPDNSRNQCDPTNGATKHISSSCSNGFDGAVNDPCLRWVYDEHFPFTSPSLELEVLHEGKWLEVLGAGEIREEIIQNACLEQQQQNVIYHELLKYLPSERLCKQLLPNARGWAFGMGIERVAMLLFSIDDIRLLWSEDPRFTQQFSDGCVKTFTPFSYMPPVFKDISFWLPAEAQGKDGTDHATDALPTTSAQTHGSEKGGNCKQCPACPPTFDLARFYEVCREEGGALVESVTLRDAFTHPVTGRKSLCFRFTYKALDRTLTHTEVNEIQDKLIAKLKETFVVELR